MSPSTPAATEQRIQRLEVSSSDFQAHAAAEEFRFEMISNQITDLGDRMEKAVGGLGGAVEKLREQHEEHGRKLDKVEGAVQNFIDASEEREEDHRRVEVLYKAHEKRKLYRKRVITAGTIVGTGLLARFGEAVWNWLATLFK